jgi:hypothetical protein
MSRRRLPAFLLLLALLGGGFGLPLADALIYHSSTTHLSIASATSATPESAVQPRSGPAHLLGCVLWLSALTGSGLQSSAPVLRASAVASSLATRVALTVYTQTDLSLGLSRAPPLA